MLRILLMLAFVSLPFSAMMRKCLSTSGRSNKDLWKSSLTATSSMPREFNQWVMYSFLRFSIASLKTSEFKILSASAALTTSSCVTDIYKLNNPLGACGKNLPCLVIGLTISSTLGWTKLETGKSDNLVKFIG